MNEYAAILKRLNIDALNEMQLATHQVMSEGQDVMLLSPTGSGKTLGFLLPLLRVLNPSERAVQALIIVPTRELALQIEQVFKSLQSGFKITCLYGGHSTKMERQSLSEAPAVIVGTPGKLSNHIKNENFNAENVRLLLMDEFDKTLEMGFEVEVKMIVENLTALAQKVLTSATAMEEIPAFLGMGEFATLNFLKGDAGHKNLEINVLHSKSKDKLKLLLKVLSEYPEGPSLVFCNHREAAERVSELLWDKGLSNGLYHGGMDQPDREKALVKFRNRTHAVLVTTDLASRGLDIPDVQQVIHYQIPFTEESFIHRNGRTARMKATGKAYLLLADEEYAPSYIDQQVQEVVDVDDDLDFEKSKWKTLYIAAGKKDKVNKIDIVGVLYKKANLSKEDIGLIEVFDKMSYVGIRSDKIELVVKKISNEQLKGRKYKMGIDQ